MANVMRRTSQVVLCGVMAAVLVGCGVSSYQLRFAPELKEKEVVQVYVYFAPEHHVETCRGMKAADVFGDSEAEAGRLLPAMLKSVVVKHQTEARVIGESLPATVAMIFVWGNFPGEVEEKADCREIAPDRFETSSFMSTEGVLRIPVKATGFGTATPVDG